MQTGDSSLIYKDLAATMTPGTASTGQDSKEVVSGSRYWAAANTPATQTETRQVNEREVEYALYYCRLDMSLTHSALARALRDRGLNDAERNLIVQTLARGERTRQRFYAHHTFRTREVESAALIEDQRTIARGVQKAFEHRAIDVQDLLRIADTNKDGSGARTFMHILCLSEAACEAGGAAEALADALWARDANSGVDRAIAAIHYAGSPERMARRLTTPARRASALEVIAHFNESDPYRGSCLGVVIEAWKRATQIAIGELAAMHRMDLMDQADEASADRSLCRFVTQPLATASV